MLRHIFHILFMVVIMTTQLFSQQSWVPFLRQDKVPPEVTLLQSDNNTVSFTVKVYGMLSTTKRIGEKNYQRLSIPNSEVITTAGEPALPVITKLIAVPDCDDISIKVIPSNEIQFSNYSVIPAPEYERQDWPDGSHSLIPIYEEDASIYASDAEFPGKYGEIIETGYVRAQKVVRITLYPIQFNPVKKTLKVLTDFQISLSFSNPSSSVNKELGIFRNMMHHVAINYELSGISASARGIYPINGNQLRKISVTTGSVNRVTNLNLLTDPTNPMPVDYLIITHSSLFYSSHLTSLANHRASYNGYDVVIVQVDATGSNNDIYDYYPPPADTAKYVSIRDFIADVYANGTANHTYDGHLGYIVLVGDAFLDDNSTEMVPASYAYHSFYRDGEYRDHASDYYYACVTMTGGSYDDDQDLMYGRISVGNEAQLSNVVNKIIDYELSSSGTWRNNIAFMSFSPWFFADDPYCDLEFKTMAQTIPQSYYISYAWRGFAADTAQAHGRPNFKHHPVDQVSQVVVPAEADEMWYRRYTGWRWGYYPNYQSDGQYSDPSNLCGSDEIDDWLYDKINAGLHTFVYEGHGRQGSLGAGEGDGRTIFRVDQVETELTNSEMYPFIISNSCETGRFDANSTHPDLGEVDCIAEKSVYLGNAGAIGFLGSTRDSDTGAFGYVDQRIIEAMFEDLSHVMGEAVMESKLNMYLLYRRQYNLYGDPALNLFPDGYTITNDITLSGSDPIDITTNIRVASGATLTIQEGVTLVFHPGTSLTINGSLKAQGTSTNHITFTSSNKTPQEGDWKWIKFDNSSGTSTLEYCDVYYADIGIWANSSPNVTLNHCTVKYSNYYGIYFLNSNATLNGHNYSAYNNSDGLFLYNSSPGIYNGNSFKYNTYGMYCFNNSNPRVGHSKFQHNSVNGIYCYSNSSPKMYYQATKYPNDGHNTILFNQSHGIYAGSGSYPVLGLDASSNPGYNSIHSNNGYEIYNGNSSAIDAVYNYWGYPNNPLGDIYGSVNWYPPWDSLAIGTMANSQQPAGEGAAVYNALGAQYFSNGQYSEALSQFMAAITHYSNSPLTRYSVSYVVNCLEAMGQMESVIERLNQIRTQFPDSRVNEYAQDRIVPLLEASGAYTQALEAALNLKESAVDADIKKANYLISAIIYRYEIKDLVKARDTFTAFVSDYPNDALCELAQIELELLNSEALGKRKLSTSVKAVPVNFALSQNYPNPFNPTTTIGYQLPQAVHVTVAIYDVQGRLVETLVNGEKAAGRYSVQWHAENVPSGVYFYRIQAGNFTTTKKLLLLK